MLRSTRVMMSEKQAHRKNVSAEQVGE